MTRSVHRACSVASHGAGQLVGFMMRIPIAAASLKHNDQVFQKVGTGQPHTHTLWLRRSRLRSLDKNPRLSFV